MNLERVNKILLIGSAISWLTIFIDGLTEEGLMIFFLTDGLYTSSTINKGISLLSIIAVITIPFLIWKKNVNRFIIVVVYLLLAIKLLKHFTDLGGYYSWIYKPKTFIPTMLFILFSITSIFIYPIYKILNQQKKKGSRHEFDARGYHFDARGCEFDARGYPFDAKGHELDARGYPFDPNLPADKAGRNLTDLSP